MLNHENHPLPTPEEVLVCYPSTTAEEVCDHCVTNAVQEFFLGGCVCVCVLGGDRDSMDDMYAESQMQVKIIRVILCFPIGFCWFFFFFFFFGGG